MNLAQQNKASQAQAADSLTGLTAQYLTFSLEQQVFAMEISTIREIVQPTDMTVVPLMPNFIRGILNLRGAVVPVIDLQVRFGGPRSMASKKTCIVIFDSANGNESTELGLQVDAVHEVVEIAHADVEPPPQFGSSINREFIYGMGKIKGEFIVILNPATALNVEDMAALVAQSHH